MQFVQPTKVLVCFSNPLERQGTKIFRCSGEVVFSCVFLSVLWFTLPCIPVLSVFDADCFERCAHFKMHLSFPGCAGIVLFVFWWVIVNCMNGFDYCLLWCWWNISCILSSFLFWIICSEGRWFLLFQRIGLFDILQDENIGLHRIEFSNPAQVT